MKTHICKIVICLLCIATSCNSQVKTPEKFKNHTVVSGDMYALNKKQLVDSSRLHILANSGAYYPKENDSLTEIHVDTILYSPDRKKYATFIITINTDDKLLDKGSKDSVHYNANCFIGRLDGNSNIKSMFWVDESKLFKFKTMQSTSDRIREMYFIDIANDAKNGRAGIQYNLDDTRFWDDSIWSYY